MEGSKGHKNSIPRLMRDDGSWATSREDILSLVTQFYSSLLGTGRNSEKQFDEMIFAARACISDSQIALEAEFEAGDVKEALWVLFVCVDKEVWIGLCLLWVKIMGL
ncbi:hypothetical protein Dimus_026243 [Dionaea muscipula]